MIKLSAHRVPSLGQRLARLVSRDNRRMWRELVVASFRVNDHNAFLGVVWSLLSPLLMLGVMYFLFKDRFGQNIPAYSAYLLLGIVTVNFFSGETRQMMPLFVTSKFLFTNSTVPRETVLAANLTLGLYKFLIELGFCLVIAFALGVFAGLRLVLLFVLVIAFTAFTSGVGLILSLLYVQIRDIEHAWSLFTRLLLFVTPIFYSLDSISPRAALAIYWLNPLTPFLIALRGIALNDATVSPFVFLHALGLGMVTFVVAYAIFLRREARAVERG